MNNALLVILPLIPLLLGLVWKYSNCQSMAVKSFGLGAIGVIAAGLFYMRFAFEVESSILFFASAIVLAGLCAILSQENSQQSSDICISNLIILGLSLGIILTLVQHARRRSATQDETTRQRKNASVTQRAHNVTCWERLLDITQAQRRRNASAALRGPALR